MAKRKRLTKKQRERRRQIGLSLLATVIIFIVGYLTGREDIDFEDVRARLDEATAQIGQRVNEFGTTSSRDSATGTSQVHILDVGQGSAVLMIASDGTSVLVDTGRYDDGEKRIISYLDKYIGLGETLDLLVFTHNDADHIGHGDLVLEYFDVEEVWMNGVDHTTKVYSNLLDAILASDAEYVEPKAGEAYERGNFLLEVLHPPVDSPGRDHNDESIVMHVSFDDLSLVTSGDASIPRENEIVNRYGSLPADILIVGHHGAADSTGENWLEAVRPQMAFYQAGANNSYGHPTPEALSRLEQYGIPTYGTTELGTISLYFDEQNEVSVETEK